jgi:hypothetical protein
MMMLLISGVSLLLHHNFSTSSPIRLGILQDQPWVKNEHHSSKIKVVKISNYWHTRQEIVFSVLLPYSLFHFKL